MPHLTIYDATVMLKFITNSNCKCSYTFISNLEFKFENGNLFIKFLNENIVYPAPIIPKDSIEVGLSIAYVLETNKEIN